MTGLGVDASGDGGVTEICRRALCRPASAVWRGGFGAGCDVARGGTQSGCEHGRGLRTAGAADTPQPLPPPELRSLGSRDGIGDGAEGELPRAPRALSAAARATAPLGSAAPPLLSPPPPSSPPTPLAAEPAA